MKWIKKKSKRSIVGQNAGCLSKNGYLRLKFDYITWPLHKIIWLIYYGEWPKGVIDHINRIRTDNRIENLRDVTPRINMQNRSDFYYGARLRPGGKWESRIQYKGENLYLGLFDTQEEAENAYKSRVKFIEKEEENN